MVDLLDADDDNDRIPDAHELLLGLDPLLTADATADATADPDKDGLTTFLEYAAGTNPIAWDAPTRVLKLGSSELNLPGTLSIQIRYRPDGPKLNLFSSQELHGPWIGQDPLALSIPGVSIRSQSSQISQDSIGGIATLTLIIQDTAPRRFYRVGQALNGGF